MKFSNCKKLLFISLVGLFLSAAFFYFFQKPPKAEAGWFDESWLYRIGLTVNNSGAADSNKKIKFDIDTATLITAGKMQVDCGDSRFTAANGEVLRYYLDASGGACNTNSTDYYVLVPTINAGATAIFHYYGNTFVINGTESAQFSEATFTPTSIDTASEEKGPGPVAYWKFDEGFGQTANDSMLSNNDGTLGATSGVEASDPTWQTEDMCVTGKCLLFDGVNDYVDAGNEASLKSSVFTYSAWVKPVGFAVAGTIKGGSAETNGAHFRISGGYLELLKQGIVLIGASNMTIPLNSWSHISVTYNSLGNYCFYINGNNAGSGTNLQTFIFPTNTWIGLRYSSGAQEAFNGFIDDVKIYPYARTAAQIKNDYASRGSSQGVSASIGSSTSNWMTQGLVGYWKMDEASWTNNCSTLSVLDASGAGNNGKACPATTGPIGAGAGKFGNGGSFDGVDDQIELGNILALSDLSLSVWIYPTASKLQFILAKASNTGYLRNYVLYLNSDNTVSYLRTDGSSQSQGGQTTQAVTLNTWNHVVVTDINKQIKIYINAGTPLLGSYTLTPTLAGNPVQIGFNYGDGNTTRHFSGSIDEVRIYNRALSPKEVSDLYNYAPGPVGYWKMDEKVSGNAKTLNDSSGNNNTGTTYYGANASGMNCTVPGKIGGGCQFDGVDDYVNVGNGVSVKSKEQSVEFWVKFNSFSNDNGLVSKGDSWLPDSGYQFFYGSNGRFYHNFVGTGGQSSSIIQGYTLNTNTWYFITLTFQMETATASRRKIYINNNLIANVADNVGPIATESNSLLIGKSHIHFLNGIIDDVRIYNYARTQKQIVEDMNGGHPAGGSPIASQVGYWKFDEGYGITANNSGFGGSSLNGTLTGMASPATSTSGWTNSGKFGKGLNFDGVDDYVAITDVFSMPVTVSFWYYSKDDTANEHDIFGKNIAGSAQIYQFSTSVGLDVNGFGDSSVFCSFSKNTWYYITAIYASDSFRQIYKNGISCGTSTTTHVTSIDFSEIGRSFGGGRYFNGMLDEVKIYNYALTEDEIKIDYNKGVTAKMGSLSTASNGVTADNSASRAFCIPGDTSACSPPVAYWNFDEKTGTSANDISGNNNIGTLGGGTANYRPAWVSGKIGGALKFDGVDDYVDMGNILDGRSSGTIALWVKPNSFVNLETIWGEASALENYLNFQGTSGAVRFKVGYASAGTLDSVSTLSLGNWNYVETTFGASGMRIYINGKLDNSNANTGTIDIHSGYTFLIGAINYYGRFFNGFIDDVRIYNYARTPAQVAWDYNRGKPVAEWKFDECQGSIANDASGNGNTGTITIGATGTQTALGTCTGVNAANAWYNGRNGKINSAMSFDGTDDYGSIPSSSSFNSTTSTWCVWFKSGGGNGSGTGTSTSTLIGRHDASGSTNGVNLLLGGQNITWEAKGGGYVYFISSSGNNYIDNNWHFACGISAPNGGVAYLYVDGIQKNSQVVSGSWSFSSQVVRIGDSIDTYWGQYNGLIDSVKIYNYALTPLQVKTEYNNGAVNFR
ncbi:hypothetical protein L6272_04660 [Microgenomates group bacterium]|nr:hypothetical protein [Microgenomates group bacterium]